MWLESYLDKNLAVANMAATSKKRVLENIAKLFADKYPQVNEDALYQNLIGRERLGSTGLGDGIAIPHCRFDTGGDTLCACITLENAIDFDAVDQAPVDIIIAMIVPDGAESDHLEKLAALAAAIQEPRYVKSLRDATDSQALYSAATIDT
ncbi:MAG: PTS system nitrogen regulatory IIA component [Flavobacteriales bacterium]|jgi:PTS system nitrogen regulatory IIA component